MRMRLLAPRHPLEAMPTLASNGGSVRTPGEHADHSQHSADVAPVETRDDDPRDNAIVANARREFANAFGDLARGKRNWQIISFFLVVVLVIQAATTLRLASSARAVPYVVQVDRIGQITAGGVAEPMRDPDVRLVTSQLAHFVRSVRTVLPASASAAQADLLRRGYAFAAPSAAGFLNNYFQDPGHDPRLLGRHLVRTVDVTSVLRVPDPQRQTASPPIQTWRLQWLETDRPIEAGDSAAVAAWEGYVTLQIVPPSTVDAIQENPLGLRITSIAWTRVGSRMLPTVDSITGSSPSGGVQ